MKRLLSIMIVVSVYLYGVVAVNDIASTENQGVPKQLQILDGKIDQIQLTLAIIQNSAGSGAAGEKNISPNRK